MADSANCRVLLLGAHPDDAEVFAGGLVVRHCRAGSRVRIISVTDGRSGHHEIPPEELVRVRRQEAQAAGERVGAEYVTWDFPDGSLEPSLEVRRAVIREVRTFKPDLILTHRPNDYHPDHRAVGSAVQDASYLVTVPHVCQDTPALRRDPVVAYMSDLFTRPNRLRADVVIDVSDEFDEVVAMAACHESQFFQWLPYHEGILPDVPPAPSERLTWLSERFRDWARQRREHFHDELLASQFEPTDRSVIEVYEVSEYARRLDAGERLRLFPGALASRVS